MNMVEEISLVSRASEEVALPYAQTVGVYSLGRSRLSFLPRHAGTLAATKGNKCGEYLAFTSQPTHNPFPTLKGVDGSCTEARGAGQSHVGQDKTARGRLG
jgi:hypothetical protein